jgi:hypothetical protein
VDLPKGLLSVNSINEPTICPATQFMRSKSPQFNFHLSHFMAEKSGEFAAHLTY